MDTHNKIHIELLKSLKKFSETYVLNKSQGSRKNSNSTNSSNFHKITTLKKELSSGSDKKLFMLSSFYSKNNKYILINQLKNVHENNSHEKMNSNKFSTDLKKKRKMKSYDNVINSSKPDQKHHHHKSEQLRSNFPGKSKFYKNARHKSQDRPIKINLVSQKFKIANDFNEQNSNQFLNDKDECLREVILSDEIEEEPVSIFAENKKQKKNILSVVRKNRISNSLNNERIKRKNINDRI